MALERAWAAVPPQTFTANGTNIGLVTVADTAGFKVKQSVVLTGNSVPDAPVQVKRVISPTQLIVGKVDNKIANWIPLDISQYTVAQNAAIYAGEQPKNGITPEDIMKAIYEADPTVALRTAAVDQYGQFLETIKDEAGVNRLAVDAEVTVNTVQLFTKPYDAIKAMYPAGDQEVYQTYLGGLSGVVQETVTVNYVDSTKNQIDTVVRT